MPNQHPILEVYAYFLNHTLDMYTKSKHHGSAEDPLTATWHDLHCSDYLCQSIMCCGDMALEGTQTTFPDPDLPRNGDYDSHTYVGTMTKSVISLMRTDCGISARSRASMTSPRGGESDKPRWNIIYFRMYLKQGLKDGHIQKPDDNSRPWKMVPISSLIVAACWVVTSIDQVHRMRLCLCHICASTGFFHDVVHYSSDAH